MDDDPARTPTIETDSIGGSQVSPHSSAFNALSAHCSPVSRPSGWEARFKKRWSSSIASWMTSLNDAPNVGRPVTHGSVAARVTQPAGYEIEMPCIGDVNAPVKAGGATAAALGDVLADGDSDPDGLGLG
jgi:hypothetical protein